MARPWRDPVVVAQNNGIVLLNGTLTGTLSGSSLTYSINVPAGAIPSQPACSGRLDGTVTAAQSPPTLTGAYAVASSTCSTGLPGGSFTLTR